jgi:hypothetical protein
MLYGFLGYGMKLPSESWYTHTLKIGLGHRFNLGKKWFIPVEFSYLIDYAERDWDEYNFTYDLLRFNESFFQPAVGLGYRFGNFNINLKVAYDQLNVGTWRSPDLGMNETGGSDAHLRDKKGQVSLSFEYLF